VGDCKIRFSTHTNTWQAQGFFEVTMHFSLLLLFDFAGSGDLVIELQWTETVVNVNSRALGGNNT
jgi:hypothetical protein